MSSEQDDYFELTPEELTQYQRDAVFAREVFRSRISKADDAGRKRNDARKAKIKSAKQARKRNR